MRPKHYLFKKNYLKLIFIVFLDYFDFLILKIKFFKKLILFYYIFK